MPGKFQKPKPPFSPELINDIKKHIDSKIRDFHWEIKQIIPFYLFLEADKKDPTLHQLTIGGDKDKLEMLSEQLKTAVMDLGVDTRFCPRAKSDELYRITLTKPMLEAMLQMIEKQTMVQKALK